MLSETNHDWLLEKDLIQDIDLHSLMRQIDTRNKYLGNRLFVEKEYFNDFIIPQKLEEFHVLLSKISSSYKADNFKDATHFLSELVIDLFKILRGFKRLNIPTLLSTLNSDKNLVIEANWTGNFKVIALFILKIRKELNETYRYFQNKRLIKSSKNYFVLSLSKVVIMVNQLATNTSIPLVREISFTLSNSDIKDKVVNRLFLQAKKLSP